MAGTEYVSAQLAGAESASDAPTPRPRRTHGVSRSHGMSRAHDVSRAGGPRRVRPAAAYPSPPHLATSLSAGRGRPDHVRPAHIFVYERPGGSGSRGPPATAGVGGRAQTAHPRPPVAGSGWPSRVAPVCWLAPAAFQGRGEGVTNLSSTSPDPPGPAPRPENQTAGGERIVIKPKPSHRPTEILFLINSRRYQFTDAVATPRFDRATVRPALNPRRTQRDVAGHGGCDHAETRNLGFTTASTT